jgi:hypothetical protein
LIWKGRHQPIVAAESRYLLVANGEVSGAGWCSVSLQSSATRLTGPEKRLGHIIWCFRLSDGG